MVSGKGRTASTLMAEWLANYVKEEKWPEILQRSGWNMELMHRRVWGKEKENLHLCCGWSLCTCEDWQWLMPNQHDRQRKNCSLCIKTAHWCLRRYGDDGCARWSNRCVALIDLGDWGAICASGLGDSWGESADTGIRWVSKDTTVTEEPRRQTRIPAHICTDKGVVKLVYIFTVTEQISDVLLWSNRRAPSYSPFTHTLPLRFGQTCTQPWVLQLKFRNVWDDNLRWATILRRWTCTVEAKWVFLRDRLF